MSLESDYHAIREGAAIGTIAARRQLAVAGQDRASYLQGLLTNDIQALVAGAGCYAAWLSPQGRMLTDMHVLESGGMILLDVPADLAESTYARLEQFVFSEDVKLGSFAQSMTSVWVHGPRAAEILEGTVDGARGLAEWTDYHHTQLEFGGEPVVVARIDQLGAPGYCLYLGPSREAALVSGLQAKGAITAGDEAIAAARVETGYPVFGIDMTDDTIPLEAGIEERAISFTKGCYVGQEIIIRVMHRGHGRVARKLVLLHVDGKRPAAGSRLFTDGRDIGFLTSVADSPRFGIIAMGYVHRDFVEPGTHVDVAMGEGRMPATITPRPMTSGA